MGSSYVKFRGSGFWSWDGYLEHFLSTLAQRVSGVESAPEWLLAARDHWILQSSGVFGGWIHPNFDEYLATDTRRDQVVQFVESIIGSQESLNELAQTSILVCRLLKSELTTDASSPLDYMVSGAHPYNWKK